MRPSLPRCVVGALVLCAGHTPILVRTQPRHASPSPIKRRLIIDWIDATALERDASDRDPDAYAASWDSVRTADGILVPGGFGDRGVMGKIAAVRHAREKLRPFLGICLGMQCAVIEFARSVLDLPLANSAEFDSFTPNPVSGFACFTLGTGFLLALRVGSVSPSLFKVVIFMPEISASQMGGTMRLGVRPTLLHDRPDGTTSLARDLYGHHLKAVNERHRQGVTQVALVVRPILESLLLPTAGTDTR